ncbi:GHMP kinase [bacterium]|nr:GHMP kinase [bacterium]
MELIRQRAYARAGLIGNPSDGYSGKTISVIVRNFFAEVVLYEWEDVEIVRTFEERNRFENVRDLVKDVELHGYGGGARLLKASIKKFVEFADERKLPLHDRRFSLRYTTNIPRQVGMAGSSAIIVAALRCLMAFYRIKIPREIQPSLVLRVETEELGIAAGLQDRVIQVYEGVVAMNFAREAMKTRDGFTFGEYEPLDPAILPPLYIAYSADRGEPTEVLHNNLRARYLEGDPKVVEAMKKFADLTDGFRAALSRGDQDAMNRLIDENFDTRRSICQVASMHVEMIQRARSAGVSAKFAGSGGAIIGLCPDDATFARLRDAMGEIHCEVIRPKIIADE